MIRASLLAAVAPVCIPAAATAESVVTYHDGNHRHGLYTVPSLTLAAAAKMRRAARFNPVLNGHIYAQPLYWNPKGAKRSLVIAATESNNVYALDDATGAVVWKRHLADAVSRSELPCGNVDPVGITGTPVIDPGSGTLYVDALSKTGKGPRHRIFALSLANGAVLPNWPLDVEEALRKHGTSFSSSTQGERSALLFFGNRLYVNYGGNYGDCGSYRGTVLQIRPDTQTIEAHWQTRANGGGIWAQGGLAGDGKSIYLTTGNTFGATKWSDGEAIIRLHPGLDGPRSAKDYFAPSNWKDLDNSDQDLGGTDALPLDIAVNGAPPAERVMAFGKDGKAYLVDRANLGGIGGDLAVAPVASGAIRTAPSIYQTESTTMVAFTSPGSGHCSGDNITMLKIAASGPSPINFAWCAPFNGGGAPIITATDGKANPIVWAVGAEGDSELHGFNALTGKAVFSGAGTAMSGLHHFRTILATRNRFYVAADGTMYAFRWN